MKKFADLIKNKNVVTCYRSEEVKTIAFDRVKTENVVSTIMVSWSMFYIISLMIIALGMFFVKMIAG